LYIFINFLKVKRKINFIYATNDIYITFEKLRSVTEPGSVIKVLIKSIIECTKIIESYTGMLLSLLDNQNKCKFKIPIRYYERKISGHIQINKIKVFYYYCDEVYLFIFWYKNLLIF
jgi:cell division protein FtsI/penicillin-binding protein 2